MILNERPSNPKAVNIVRPSVQQPPINYNRYSNYSTSTESSTCTLSTTSTAAFINTPMIRQASMESAPGLSFFCQNTTLKNKPSYQNIVDQANYNQPPEKDVYLSSPKSPQPLVISRIHLSNFQQQRPTLYTTLDDDSIITLDEEEEEDKPSSEDHHDHLNRLSSFAPRFGIMGNTGLGSFMLRGNIATPLKPQLDEARVYRKIEDLEIEKKSLLTLNQTLETVVRQQSHTIEDLQRKLASIERPLTPGLDTSLSKNGIMVTTEFMLDAKELERVLEEEDAAFERVKRMLRDLIEQAQCAIALKAKVSGRVISDHGTYASNVKRRDNNRPRSVVSDGGRTVNTPQRTIRRTSVSSVNSVVNTPKSPTTPIPTRRYTNQRSHSRLSSPAVLMSTSSGSNTSDMSRPSKYNIISQDKSPRKWLN